jgi:hypothetical protein
MSHQNNVFQPLLLNVRHDATNAILMCNPQTHRLRSREYSTARVRTLPLNSSDLMTLNVMSSGWFPYPESPESGSSTVLVGPKVGSAIGFQCQHPKRSESGSAPDLHTPKVSGMWVSFQYQRRKRSESGSAADLNTPKVRSVGWFPISAPEAS